MSRIYKPDNEVLDKVKKLLDAAPSPEARQARKLQLYLYAYGAPNEMAEKLDPIAYPKGTK